MDTVQFNTLIRKVEKDAVAFTKLYTYYFPRICVYLGRKYRDAAFGEDIAQEFFLKLREMHIPDWIEFPTIWIHKICDNMALTEIRRQNVELVPLCHQEALAAEADETVEDLKNGGISPENIEALKLVDATTLEIIVMHFWEGYSFEEIAEVLELTEAVVRKRLSRAYKKMREYLHLHSVLTLLLGMMLGL